MKWFLFARRTESPAAEEFDALLSEVIDDFEEYVEEHRQKLNALREAIGGR